MCKGRSHSWCQHIFCHVPKLRIPKKFLDPHLPTDIKCRRVVVMQTHIKKKKYKFMFLFIFILYCQVAACIQTISLWLLAYEKMGLGSFGLTCDTLEPFNNGNKTDVVTETHQTFGATLDAYLLLRIPALLFCSHPLHLANTKFPKRGYHHSQKLSEAIESNGYSWYTYSW